MPDMPTTFQRFAKPAADDGRRRPFEDRRGSSSARGYGVRWRKARDHFLAMHPLCMICDRNGVTQQSVAVDHLIPWTPANGFHYEPLDFSPLCVIHHNADKQRADQFEHTPIGQTIIPTLTLKPSAIPLTVVCGPPGAGKADFVWNNHDLETDIVIDLDAIMRARHGEHGSRRGFYDIHGVFKADWDGRLSRALQDRNGMLHRLAGDTTRARAWFIVAAPDTDERRKWGLLLKPQQFVIIDAPVAQCERRIRASPHRRGREAMAIEWARDWRAIYNKTFDDFSVGERLTG